jgi:hypothetical protein
LYFRIITISLLRLLTSRVSALPCLCTNVSIGSWWQYVLLVVLIGIALYFCNMNKDYIGELCGVSLAKMQPGGGRNSHALGIVSTLIIHSHKHPIDARRQAASQPSCFLQMSESLRVQN